MSIKSSLQTLIGATLTLVLFNNCSDFEVSSSSSLSSASCAMKAPAEVPTSLTLPFRTKKISAEISNEEDLVMLVSNACIKGRAPAELSRASRTVRLSTANENLGLWSYKVKKSELNLSSQASMDEIENDSCVIGIGPNRTYTMSAYTSASFTDPLYVQQSTLTRINFFDSLSYFYRDIYGIATGGGVPKVTVAVIDTGVNYDHPDLNANMLRGPNGYGVDAVSLGTSTTIYNGSDIDTAVSHGTHVSGIIAAVGANGIGLTGVAPKGINILPIRGFYLQGSTVTSDTDTIAKAVIYATNENADVINLSLGGSGDDPVLKAALLDAVAKGTFITVAAGNEAQTLSSTFKRYPASYSAAVKGMVSVASIDSVAGTLSTFSNRSNTEVEIAAPGNTQGTTGIISTFGAAQYASIRGTSQAAPHVAGAAALIIALLQENGVSKPTPAVIESLLLSSAAKMPGLQSTVLNGNLLDLKKLGETVNAKYPATIGRSGCP